MKLFPDYQLIDSLVIRDFYHRYTVDEHTFLTVESLHHLLERPGKEPPNEWEHYFSDLLRELEQPELLYLSLLFHDIGKGLPGDSHVASGLPVMERSLRGIGVHQEELETVRFLITEHLAMSATLRRDIFDHETVRGFADKIGTPERLKMLCLMTYADIRSVNPEALTPWKAESLWRLYMAAANYMNRSVDDDRFHAEFEAETLTRIGELVPKKSAELQKYLEGLPHRYLRTHSPIQIAKHFEMSTALAKKPVQYFAETHAWTVRTDDTDRRSSFGFRYHCGGALRVGHEHREGERICQSGRHHRRHLLLQGSFPHAGVESSGTRSLRAQHRASALR